jgi:hypothetical protein
MFLQVAGVVAGVAGAWYAFKQYRLATNSKREDAQGTASGVQTFTCARYTDEVSIYVAIVAAVPGLPGMIWVTMAEGDFNGPGHRIGSGLIFGAFILLSVFAFDRSQSPFTVELSDQHFAVHQSHGRPREFRIPWHKIDHFVFSPESSAKRKVIAVLPEGHGYLPELPQDRYSKQHGGYEMCDLREVRPSEEALRKAITRCSGLEIR